MQLKSDSAQCHRMNKTFAPCRRNANLSLVPPTGQPAPKCLCLSSMDNPAAGVVLNEIVTLHMSSLQRKQHRTLHWLRDYWAQLPREYYHKPRKVWDVNG
ncbi:hypothetical protein CHS0354_003342 [Potamilus streckersoni]|uniref:Uncharacterized protein n=1 Tax=Potamilus streckersoni TaxID=2493646 RepID=A0AAE0VP75_9BIVA|nr:hypothetical protein CHS0354_003342 [Potamilus streckersoni]